MSVPRRQRAKHRGHGFTGTGLRTAAGCLKNVKQLSIISFCWYVSNWRAMASWCATVNSAPAEKYRSGFIVDAIALVVALWQGDLEGLTLEPRQQVIETHFVRGSRAHAYKPNLSSGKCLYFCLGPWPRYGRFPRKNVNLYNNQYNQV